MLYRLRGIWRYSAAIATVAAATGLAEALYRLTGLTRLSGVFLTAVLVTAYFLGSGPAYCAAVLAFVLYNFYVAEPRFTFSLDTAEDFLTLAVFLIAAMLTGSLTGRVRDAADRSEGRARTTSVLFNATREFSAAEDEGLIQRRLAHHLAAAARGSAVVLSGGEVLKSPSQLPIPIELLRRARELTSQAGLGEPTSIEADGGWTLRPLFADRQALGVAAWRTDADGPLDTDERALLDILADAAASAIARARLAAGKASAEARAQTEGLRNALLSSVSHDLRTPLAAIVASASSLQEFGENFDTATRRDLAATIQEEAERLDAFVANLLNMSKLESGALAPQHIAFSLGEVIDRVARRHGAAQGRSIHVDAGRRDLEALGDPVLFEQALGNVVENALRYSPPEGRVAIDVTWVAGTAVVCVTDEGAGVPGGDLGRIFEKFYRASNVSKPGTGLGLSIAKGLIEAMGGTIFAANRDGASGGLAITVRLRPADGSEVAEAGAQNRGGAA